MKKTLYYFLSALCIISITFTSCLSDPLAFDVVESPVLMEFEGPDGSAEKIEVVASVMELDKSGILDQNVGIVSTPVSGLLIKVYINEDQLVGEVTTDSSGKASFSADWSAV